MPTDAPFDEVSSQLCPAVGVDLTTDLVRVGVFDSKGHELGSHNLRAHPDRGLDALVSPVARCVEEAVDDADLHLSAIGSLGIAIPEAPTGPSQPAFSISDLLNTPTMFSELLHGRLGRRPGLYERYHASTAAVLAAEFGIAGGAALFLGKEFGGGLLQHGDLLSGSELDVLRRIIDSCRDALLKDPSLTSFCPPEGRLFRDRLRCHDAEITHYLVRMANHGGQAVAGIVRAFHPEVLVLGGDAFLELNRALTAVLADSASHELGHPLADHVRVVVSTLGDSAYRRGAALLASQRRMRGRVQGSSDSAKAPS